MKAKQARQTLRKRYGDDCWICGEVMDFTLWYKPWYLGFPHDKHQNTATIEHVVPKAKGGSNKMSNLRLTHRKCNHERGSALLQ